jgi:nicotinamidase-related amidase
MPIDLRDVLEPARTAVLVIECQEGIVGETSPLRDLAQSVREGAMLQTLCGLLACARRVGARVYHCTVENRPDGLGQLTHTPIGARALQPAGGGGMSAGSTRAAIVSLLGPEPPDVVAPRDHGLTAFHETGLDVLLRSAGVRTVVITGVSVNIAITGAAIDAVNRGYTVVIPTDCVAGAPASYARDALRYTLRNLAYLSTAEEVCGYWGTPVGK